MDVTTGTLAHNGGDLHWEAAGAGQPVVLVHGFSLDRRMWDDQFAPLAEHFRVVRYDLRGFGKSSVPNGPYSHVDDLAALVRRFASPGVTFEAHPIFGPLSHAEWMTWGWRHVDHHLRQFGL